MPSLVLGCLQAPTTVLSAAVVSREQGAKQLLVCLPDRLQLWGWIDERPVVLAEIRSQPRLLHATVVPAGPQGQQAVLVVAEAAAAVYTLGPTGELLLSATADLGGLQVPRLPHPCFSNVVSLSKECSVLAAGLHEGFVHMLTIRWDASNGNPGVTCTANQPLADVVSSEAGATVLAESIAVMPSHLPTQANQCCLSVLFTAYGIAGLGAEKCVASVDSDESGILRTGAWFVRNLHDSTTLVEATPSSPSASQGTLVGSGSGLLFIPASAPHRKLAIEGSLPGGPTCVGALGAGTGKYVVGDSQGGLHLLDLQRGKLARVPLSSPVAAPSTLAFLSGWADAATAAGLLFVGSQAGASGFVEVPWAALQATAAPLISSCAADTPRWEVLSPDQAAIPSLAPVRGGMMIPDPAGSEDLRLLLPCGTGPSGRLALAHWAANLVPAISGGPAMQGQVRLLALRDSVNSRHHSYLLFSFDADCSSSQLDIRGTTFQQASIPGLLQDQATLACANMAGGHLLQITPQGAYTIKPASGAVVSSWPGQVVSLAAVHEQYAALASGSTVHVLHISSATGKLQVEREMQLEQQVSALALFELKPPGADIEGSGEVWLATGQWISNQVVLQQLSADGPACQPDLGERQPRSLAVCCLSGAQYLFVGTNTGELMWWELKTSLGSFGALSVDVSPCEWARVGSAPVELHSLRQPTPPAPAPSPASTAGRGPWGVQEPCCILAKSDQLLLLTTGGTSPVPGLASGSAPRLSAVRVHGGQNLKAIVPVHTTELPNSLAWVTSAGDLQFGRLDATQAVRWDSIPLAATPALVAYHQASRCAAVACIEPGSRHSLRLVNMGEPGLAPAEVPLAEGHAITAMAMASISCSGAAADLAQERDGLPGCKEFLFVASCLEGQGAQVRRAQVSTAADGGADQSHGPLVQPGVGDGSVAVRTAAAAGDAEPWWRTEEGRNAWQHAAPSAEDAPTPGEQLAVDRLPPLLQGLLSVFEIKQCTASPQATAAAPAASKPCYELVLHGTCPLDTVAFSLAAVTPDSLPYTQYAAMQQMQVGSSSQPAQSPMLVLGCYDGLRLYRVYIDDAGREGLAEVERGLQSIGLVEPLQFDSLREPGPAAAGEASSSPATATSATRASLQRLWHQRVALECVSKAPTFNEGLPVSLLVAGPTVFGSELLSSVTVYQVRPAAPGQLPMLIPFSADATGSHAAAALPLASTAVLLGKRPHGLALMQRSLDSEAQQHAEAKRLFERALERGRDPEGAGPGRAEGEARPNAANRAGWLTGAAQQQGQGSQGGGPMFVPGIGDAAELEVLAACMQPHAPAALCAGQLGIPVHAMAESGGSAHLAAPGSAEQQQVPAVVVSVDGAVHSVHLIGEGEQGRCLRRLQEALKRRQQQLAAVGQRLVLDRQQLAWSDGQPDGDPAQLGDGCIDADSLTRVLSEFGSVSDAASSLGLPVLDIEEACKVLRYAMCSQS